MTAAILSSLLDGLGKLPPAAIYSIVGLLVFGEAALFVGFVLPGETAVLVAGAIASTGRINIVWLCVLVVVAAIVGDTVGYAVGHRYGEKLLTLRILRHRQGLIHAALTSLKRRGPLFVFAGRFTAFLRAVAPGLAGMSKMHYRSFLGANAAGGLVWGVSFTLLGYFAGSALSRVEKYASWFALVLLAVIITVAVLVHRRTRRRELAVEEAWETAHPDEPPTA
jgi:membrane protein DedA with SNARE-associated domain